MEGRNRRFGENEIRQGRDEMNGGQRDRDLAPALEEMARAVFGLPRDKRSLTAAAEMADLLRKIAGLRFERNEEPTMPGGMENRDADKD